MGAAVDEAMKAHLSVTVIAAKQTGALPAIESPDDKAESVECADTSASRTVRGRRVAADHGDGASQSGFSLEQREQAVGAA